MSDKIYNKQNILVVIPAYNEQANIVSVVEEVKKAGYDYIVINDGSCDETLAVCKENNIRVLNLCQNLGIGGAVQAGHKYALLRGYEADIQFDGDGQHDVQYIPALLESLENGADLAIGSRFIRNSGGFQSSSMRRFGIKLLKRWIHTFTNETITDATSGFRASNKRAIELFCRYYPQDYPEPESIVAAHNHGLKISEVPVVMRERQGGKSSISLFSSAYYMVKVMLAIVFEGVSRKTVM